MDSNVVDLRYFKLRSNNISLKYQRCTTLGSKDIGIINSEFVAKTQFLCLCFKVYIKYINIKITFVSSILSMHMGSWEQKVFKSDVNLFPNLPLAEQSALVPQGEVEQGSSLHSWNGSPVYPSLHLQTALLPGVITDLVPGVITDLLPGVITDLHL